MGLIEKKDLKLDYDWSTQPGDGPIKKDEVDSTLFNSESGDDVLSLLNKYAEKKESDDKQEVLKAEDLISSDLPKDLNTEKDVFDWLWTKMGNTKKT
ncbi:hypothetical protein ACKGJO_00295 [Gracilimonas sp. Q87]|uniref:hypothetical protein n=1 Tax=Gracilimonas sp. Q87 TaxID=3384766 RepID=UPI003983EC8A